MLGSASSVCVFEWTKWRRSPRLTKVSSRRFPRRLRGRLAGTLLSWVPALLQGLSPRGPGRAPVWAVQAAAPRNGVLLGLRDWRFVPSRPRRFSPASGGRAQPCRAARRGGLGGGWGGAGAGEAPPFGPRSAARTLRCAEPSAGSWDPGLQAVRVLGRRAVEILLPGVIRPGNLAAPFRRYFHCGVELLLGDRFLEQQAQEEKALPFYQCPKLSGYLGVLLV